VIHKKLKIGKETIPYHIPESWEDVTFKQFLECSEEKDGITRVSILTGVPKEFFQYDELINHYIWLEGQLSWSHQFKEKESSMEMFKTLEGYFYFPEDVEMKSIGAYKDIQSEAQEVENPLEVYPFIVSAYYVLERDGEYDYGKAKEMISYFENQPCTAVINSGSFFLNKLERLRNGTKPTQKTLVTRAIKYLQDMIGFQKSLGLKRF